MTRVGGPGPNLVEGFPTPAENERGTREDRFAGGRPGRESLGREMGFQSGVGGQSSTDERETSFREKMRQALGEAKIVEDRNDEQGSQRLLAIAGVGVASLPANAVAPADQQVGLSPGVANQVDMLTHRIEQALRAEMRDGVPAGFSLRLDLPDAGSISGVTITMSSDSIDIVFTRAGSETTAEYLLAAQALAERLQARFSRRIVRIHEVDGSPETKPSQGLDEISRLLGRSGDRS